MHCRLIVAQAVGLLMLSVALLNHLPEHRKICFKLHTELISTCSAFDRAVKQATNTNRLPHSLISCCKVENGATKVQGLLENDNF